jgi:orotate phosphoribosyltransferase
VEKEDFIKIFKDTNALLQGHFLLTSGLHSPTYFQCAQVLQYPEHITMLCGELAQKIKVLPVDVVVSPAIGGLVVGQELGRLLKKRAIFAERENGSMTLRRGFAIRPGEHVLVVEDVVTTGGSVQEIISIAQASGGKVTAVGSIVDRSSKKIDFPAPFFALLKMEVVAYPPSECPLCKQNLPVIKPGSRKPA